MSLYQRDGVWWIDLRHRGRRVRRTTHTRDKQTAKRQHDELAARLWQAKQTGFQLSDALLAWVQAKPRAPSNLRALKRIRADYHDRPLIDVTEPSVIAAFGTKKAGTYNRLVAILRAAMNQAEKAGWIEKAPHLGRRTEPPPRTRFLTADEWKRLRDELPDHLRRMADFAVMTGLRWENVAGLEWERVDLRRKVAWVEAVTAKGRRPIRVDLSADAIAALRDVPGERTGFVFTYAGRRIQSPKTGFNSAIKRAKLTGVTWHTLRRTWASWHVMNGTPLEVVQHLGGWRTRSQVEIYARLAPSYVAQFADNARPVGNQHGKKKRAA